MGGEQQPRAWLGAGQVNDQIAHFGRKRDPLVCGVIADGAGRHARLLQLIHKGSANRGLMARDAVNREQADQRICRVININKLGNAGHGSFLPI
jgi:hypothetical protein